MVPSAAPLPTTMLPFLYQTKTLSYLFSTTPVFRPHVQTLPRYISTSARRARGFDLDSVPVTRRSAENNADPGSARSTTSTPTWDSEAQSAGSQRILPRQLQSRRPNDNGIENTRSKRDDDNQQDFNNDFSMPTTIDFEGVNADTYQPRESTITYREKVAFQKIFTDILERTQKARPQIAQKDGNVEALPEHSPGGQTRAKTALNDILASAIQAPKTRKELEEAINTYPPVLREEAAKAIFAGKESLSDAQTADQQNLKADEHDRRAADLEILRAKADELEALRAPERLRVETLMRNAKTDFELWEIMEKEVFSMISKLGLEENGKTPEPPKVGKKLKGWKKLQRQQEAEKRNNPNQAQDQATEIEEVETETKDKVLPLQLYGPLYPSYLLLGLRLLDRSFAKPSPIALSILPKIKSLGFISHVLGASTQFYNDLLRIYRYRYDDFQGMIDLMREMEQSALDMDDETITIVLDVLKVQGSVSNFERGNAVKALWRMPEFAPAKFGTWKEKIAKDIAERKLNASMQTY